MNPIMNYACPAWEFAADTNLSKLQRLQNFLLTNGNFPGRTRIRKPYVYDFIT